MNHYISFDVGTVNLGVAAASVETNGDAVLDWLDTANISASCSDRCLSRLWTYLDELMELLGWQKYSAFIEKQPMKVCSLMRTVELGIRHYFLMRAHRGQESVNVKSVSPRRKLSAPVIYSAGASSSQKYKARKNAGLSEAIGAFSGLPDVVEFLKTGKGDDAADASLYLVHFGGARNFLAVSPDALRNARSRADVKAAQVEAKVSVRQAKIDAKRVDIEARAIAKELKLVSKLKVCLPHRDVLAAIAA
jgi:hypothetical protein